MYAGNKESLAVIKNSRNGGDIVRSCYFGGIIFTFLP
jgi:hypothetical protein